MGKKLRYPTGVRPLLVEETARRRRIEARFVDAARARRLRRGRAADHRLRGAVRGDRHRAAARQSYRFIDRDGELVAIRSDFTPMVARALAPSITPERSAAARLLSRRCHPLRASRLGANREMFQIGAEIIGDARSRRTSRCCGSPRRSLARSTSKPLIVYTDATIPERIGSRRPRSAGFEASSGRRVGPSRSCSPRAPRPTDDLREFPPTREVAERLDAIARAVGDDSRCTSTTSTTPRLLHRPPLPRLRATSRTRSRRAAATTRSTPASAPPRRAVGFTFTIDDLD